jgi:putative heme-binding domain-containing protein
MVNLRRLVLLPFASLWVALIAQPSSSLQGYQADNQWSSTELPKGNGPLPASLKSIQGRTIHLRSYCIVPSGWTDASGPNVITQSISLLIPESFPKGKWWVNGRSLGAPIRVTNTVSAATSQTDRLNYQRLAVPYGVLKKDQTIQIDVVIEFFQGEEQGTIAAPNIASYHEEISLAGVWLLNTTPSESIEWERMPASYKAFDKVVPGTTPLAAPAEFQATRHMKPDESLQAMTVADGLKVELMLAEPDVGQPVGMHFDNAGRLWIAEYRQYPYPAGMKIVSRDKFYRAVYDIFPAPPPNGPRGHDRISVHEDTDGDGNFDRHHHFVDGLNIASSALPTAEGVWVLNPPYLLFYRDEDHDLKADGTPEVHLTGFGMEDTHSVANSLRLGPDGWIYGAMGSTVSSSISVAGREGPPLQCEGAAIWRYHPSTKRYEIYAEGGGNAFCVSFDAEGRLYSGHNGNDTRGFHYWQGAYYRKDEFKHGVVSNPYAYGFLGYMQHPPTPRFSHALVRYSDTELPQRFHQQLLAVDPLKGTVVLSKMTPKGGTFATEDIENSLSTNDYAFRPVDIQVGPDGNVYVADWCEEFIAHGQHYLGMLDSDTGRVYRLSHSNKESRPLNQAAIFANLTLNEQFQQLESPDQTLRAVAREYFVQKGTESSASIVAPLQTILQQSHSRSALESLWILHRLSGLRNQDWSNALHHANSAVRMWAVRLIGDWQDTSNEYTDELLELARLERNPEVLCQLACTAKRLNSASAIQLIRILASKDSLEDDPNYGLLLWWGIEPHLQTGRNELLTWLSEPESWKSTWLVDTVSERIVRKLLSTQSRKDAMDVALMYQAASKHAAESLSGLQRGFDQGTASRGSLDLPRELIEAVLASGGGTLSLRLRLNDADAKRETLSRLQADKTSLEEKRKLLQTIAVIRDSSFEAALVELILSVQSTDVRLEALYALEAISAPKPLESLLTQFATLPPELQAGLMRVLARREATGLKLLEAVELRQIETSAITSETRDLLASHPSAAIQDKVRQFLPESKPLDDEATRSELTRWNTILDGSGGNPYQGKVLFTEQCGKCHKLFNEGGDIGPELTRYNRDDRNTMLLNILRPSQEIREGFRTFQALTIDGRVATGFVVDDNEEIVTLRESSGQSITIAKEELEEYKATPKSIMPDGLLDKLSEEQVRDLFAYLQSGQPLGR